MGYIAVEVARLTRFGSLVQAERRLTVLPVAGDITGAWEGSGKTA